MTSPAGLLWFSFLLLSSIYALTAESYTINSKRQKWCVWMSVCVCVSMCVYICICLSLCMCVCVPMYICLSVCVCVHVRVCSCTHNCAMFQVQRTTFPDILPFHPVHNRVSFSLLHMLTNSWEHLTAEVLTL